MAIEDPGTLTVVCDVCDDQTEMDTTAYAGNGMMCHSYGVDDSTITENGWAVVGGQILCPTCAVEAIDEEEVDEEDTEDEGK